jgi:hypothetical protein
MLWRVLIASFIVGVIVWPFACYARPLADRLRSGRGQGSIVAQQAQPRG